MPLVSEQELCIRCRSREYSFDAHRAAFLYADAPARLIHAYKFGGRLSLAPLLADMLQTVSASLLSRSRWLAPIPGSRGKRRRRGFGPTDLLCRALSRASGVPMTAALARSRGSEQKTLSYSDRLRAASGAYVMRRGCRPVSGATLCLVDDVFTTGATASACAAVLKRAGAATVYVVTLAMD